MTWNEGDSDHQRRQRRTVATASPRININGEPSSSSGSLPSFPQSPHGPGETEQHSGKGNNKDVVNENDGKEKHEGIQFSDTE
eukprot:10549798-Heterocapsa_arctica.AAC.1